MTDDDVYGCQHVDCTIAPVTRSMKLLLETRQPYTEHPTVAAHEPRQQKPAQQKLREPTRTKNFSEILALIS